MSLNVTYHFHKIAIKEPQFSKFYFDLYKKINYPDYRDWVIRGLKNQLKNLILSGKETGVRVDPEPDIYKPLKGQGYPSDGVAYMLRDLGPDGEKYLDNYGNDASLKITPKGKQWAMDLLQRNQNPPTNSTLNYFDIPDATSPKLKSLLLEINNLGSIESGANLIGHQLRTVLNLVLKQICKSVLQVEIPDDKQNLRPLLIFTIECCAKKKNKRIADELVELKDSKYKDIIDDVIHDDHTTANPLIIENMMSRIKHILSLAYR